MTCRILIVDDERDMEPLFRQKLRHEVQAGRFELDFAFSAREALALMDKVPPPGPHLVLSDINMPGMSGLELVSQLRPRWPDLAISMLSAYDDAETLALAQSKGADRIFSKPIDFAALKAYMDSICA